MCPNKHSPSNHTDLHQSTLQISISQVIDRERSLKSSLEISWDVGVFTWWKENNLVSYLSVVKTANKWKLTLPSKGGIMNCIIWAKKKIKIKIIDFSTNRIHFWCTRVMKSFIMASHLFYNVLLSWIFLFLCIIGLNPDLLWTSQKVCIHMCTLEIYLFWILIPLLTTKLILFLYLSFSYLTIIIF